jgi:hypothetical protein
MRGNERRKTAVAPDFEGNQPPPNTAEFRIALLRKIATYAGWWRRCREPVCRRSRRCLSANLRCHDDQPRRKRTPEQEARIMAELKRELERRLGTG